MAQSGSQRESLRNLKVCKVIVYKLPLGKKGRLKPITKRTRQRKLSHGSKQFEINIAQKQEQQKQQQ